LKIRDVMRVEVVTALPETPVKTAFELMRKGGFRHLPVVDAEGKIVGIVSDRDIRNVAVFFDKKAQNPTDYHISPSTLTRDIMTANPVTVSPENDLSVAADLLAEHHYGCLPVVDAKGKVAGILTRSDMMRLLAKLLKTT
jgi:CBS domain-containing protein